MEELCATMAAASLCGLGQSAANPVLSTLKYFREEYEAHVREKKCPALVCRPLLKYTVDPGNLHRLPGLPAGVPGGSHHRRCRGTPGNRSGNLRQMRHVPRGLQIRRS